MNKKTILVVMPVYNSEKTLRQAIESILNQTYENFMLVIVDDCSTDNSYEIARSYKRDKRVVVKRNSKNMGAYYSRNIGLYYFRNANWGYFTTHDADDISYNFRFATAIRLLKKSNLIGVEDMFERKDLDTGKSISTSLTMAHAFFRREVFEKLGYFDLVRFGADWEYWARVKIYGKLNKKVVMSYKNVVGESFIHQNNLTVQIPIGSEPRQEYIEFAKHQHAKIKNIDDCYISFSPKDTPRASNKISKPDKTKKKNSPKVYVVLLTWKRIRNLRKTLSYLSKQTHKDFSVYISNGNLDSQGLVDRYADMFKTQHGLDIEVSHDGNDLYAFRRVLVGKKLAERDADIILFIDDDILFSSSYVEQCIKQYKPKTYSSGFVFSFQDNGSDYYGRRTRHWDNDQRIHYCGTGVSMIDAKIFLDDGLMNAPIEAHKVEDLWISYYAQQVKKWKLRYIQLDGIKIGGADNVALYKEIQQDKFNKADLLRMLVNDYGWQL